MNKLIQVTDQWNFERRICRTGKRVRSIFRISILVEKSHRKVNGDLYREFGLFIHLTESDIARRVIRDNTTVERNKALSLSLSLSLKDSRIITAALLIKRFNREQKGVRESFREVTHRAAIAEWRERREDRGIAWKSDPSWTRRWTRVGEAARRKRLDVACRTPGRQRVWQRERTGAITSPGTWAVCVRAHVHADTRIIHVRADARAGNAAAMRRQRRCGQTSQPRGHDVARSRGWSSVLLFLAVSRPSRAASLPRIDPTCKIHPAGLLIPVSRRGIFELSWTTFRRKRYF